MRPVVSDLAPDAARKWGSKPAFMFPGTRTLTFDDVEHLAGRIAGGLARAGVAPGDRVVLHIGLPFPGVEIRAVNTTDPSLPCALWFVDDLPKTSTGKIMRRALRERHP